VAGVTIGELRDRVTVQQRAASLDDQGGRTATWSTFVANLSANVDGTAKFGTEQTPSAGAAVRAVARYLVTLRYRADLSVAMRLQWTRYRASTATTLEIHTVRDLDGRRRFVVLDCSEVQA
jgi:head-tail adaptor